METNKDVTLILNKDVAVGTKSWEAGDYQLHYHDHFEMELVVSGHGRQNLNGQVVELNPGDIYLMRPLDYHKIHSENIELLTINIKPDLLPKWMVVKIHSLKNQKVYRLLDEEFEQFVYLANLLKNEIKKENTIYNLTSNLISMIFIIYLRNAKNELSSDYDFTSKVIYYIQKDNRFTKKITLDEIANYVGYSKYYTSTTFHKKFSITIQDFIINLRVEYAKKLLLESGFSISEIVNQSGFVSVSNFYNIFTKLTGCTPSKFKKEQM